MLLQKTVLSPNLVNGVFTQEFGEFANIVSAKVVMTNPFKDTILFGVSCSYTGNLLTVTVEKETMGALGWAAATTANVNGCTFTMLVDGE